MRGTKRDAQRAAAGLVSEADHGRIPLTKETFGGLLARWLDHIEARGRSPKTLVENRRMAAAFTEELWDYPPGRFPPAGEGWDGSERRF